MTSFSPAWVVELATRPSRFQQCLTLALHALALLALQQAEGLPWPLRLVLAGGVVLSAALGVRSERRRGEFLREAGDEWWLECRGRSGMVKLSRARTWRYLVVAEFEGEWQGRRRREHLVLWPDAVAPDDFRRLRVRLRCGPVPGRREAEPRKVRPPKPAGPASGKPACLTEHRS